MEQYWSILTWSTSQQIKICSLKLSGFLYHYPGERRWDFMCSFYQVNSFYWLSLPWIAPSSEVFFNWMVHVIATDLLVIGDSNGFCWFRPIFYNEQFAIFQPVNCTAGQKSCKIILSINHTAFLPFSLCINQSGLFISHVESMELR
jgi:hypothetical protein